MTVKRVCVVGAGPSGIFSLRALQKLHPETQVEVVCFERYDKTGGIWNFTGVEEVEPDGLPKHSSMYHGLRSNGPKECLELPDFPFPHGFTDSSFPPRDPLHKYLTDYFHHFALETYVKYQHWVDNVSFDKSSETFTVRVKDLKTGDVTSSQFDYVIVATGHFNYPNAVSYPGQESFPGTVIHSRNFMGASRYTGKRVLVVGSSYSAEDIALKTNAAGAERVTVSYRTRAMGFNWPHGIDERPILTRIQGSKVSFKDGSEDVYDVIIYCTGFLNYYPFMDADINLVTKNVMAPRLFKQIVFPENNRVFYIGMQDQYYTFTMFWLQAHYAAQVIQGRIQLPSYQQQLEYIEKDQEIGLNLDGEEDEINYQSDYINDLSRLTGLPSCDARQLFIEWEHHKQEDINTYREKKFESIFK